MRAGVVWLMLAGWAGAQGVIGGQVQGVPQGPPRDPRPSLTTGTGVIAGRVTTADTGAPVRRATVTLTGPGRPRMTYTDDDGRYEFTRLPSGSYTLSAGPGSHRATYLNVSYGQRTPLVPPRRIEVADSQRIENADIALPRAGVITGRVVDPFGEPAARVSVNALLVRPGAPPARQSAPANTDDQGQFRLFGLQPGDYIVVAESRMAMGGGITDTEGEAVGFTTTYAPGTLNERDASRVRVAPGAETAIDIRLIETRLFTVSGQVVSSGGELPQNVNVALARSEGTNTGMFSVPLGPNGTFTFRNVAPGAYEVIARHVGPRDLAMLPSGPLVPQEMGSARVDVIGADVENVVVPMRPGDTVTGEIAFDDVPPASYRANVFVTLPERRPFMQQPNVQVSGNLFTVRGLFGPVLLRGSVMVTSAGPWTLRAVLLDGRDITDVPVALGSGHAGRLQLLFTTRAPSLEGRVADESGSPTREAVVFTFGADEDTWTPYSSRMRSMPIANDEGTFIIRGLRDGRYYVVALPLEMRMLPQSPDRELLGQLKKVATEVVLNAGETRTVDLRVVRFEQ